jgi:hypothetical protein
MKIAMSRMIGSGMPISQSNAPFPKPQGRGMVPLVPSGERYVGITHLAREAPTAEVKRQAITREKCPKGDLYDIEK